MSLNNTVQTISIFKTGSVINNFSPKETSLYIFFSLNLYQIFLNKMLEILLRTRNINHLTLRNNFYWLQMEIIWLMSDDFIHQRGKFLKNQRVKTCRHVLIWFLWIVFVNLKYFVFNWQVLDDFIQQRWHSSRNEKVNVLFDGTY